MKQSFSPLFSLRVVFVLMSIVFTLAYGTAQDSIVVYSDTTSVLESAGPDSLQVPYSPSGAHHVNYQIDLTPSFFQNLLSNLFGFTGIMAFLLIGLIILFPLLAIAAIIYLIYRATRNPSTAPPSGAQTPAAGSVAMKQQAIHRACWGVGLIVVEWIINWSALFYVAGVVLLCMAIAQWLSASIKKDQ